MAPHPCTQGKHKLDLVGYKKRGHKFGRGHVGEDLEGVGVKMGRGWICSWFIVYIMIFSRRKKKSNIFFLKRGGGVEKWLRSICYSSRGSSFPAPIPSNSLPPGTPASGILHPLLDSTGTCTHVPYTQTHVHVCNVLTHN